MSPNLTLLRIHRFLSTNLFYPIALSSLLALAFWWGRIFHSDQFDYPFLPWNLMLAWIPYLLSLLVALVQRRNPGHWWALVMPFGFWLIFFPNAPYLVTDLLHLDPQPPVPVWYDMGLYASYIWTGCLIAVVSLNIMQVAVRRYVGSFASWLFVLGTLVLSGLGIYMGRFRNWNSWDLFIQPQQVMDDMIIRLVHPIRFFQVYGVTIFFTLFLLVCYLAFVYVHRRELK